MAVAELSFAVATPARDGARLVAGAQVEHASRQLHHVLEAVYDGERRRLLDLGIESGQLIVPVVAAAGDPARFIAHAEEAMAHGGLGRAAAAPPIEVTGNRTVEPSVEISPAVGMRVGAGPHAVVVAAGLQLVHGEVDVAKVGGRGDGAALIGVVADLPFVAVSPAPNAFAVGGAGMRAPDREIGEVADGQAGYRGGGGLRSPEGDGFVGLTVERKAPTGHLGRRAVQRAVGGLVHHQLSHVAQPDVDRLGSPRCLGGAELTETMVSGAFDYQVDIQSYLTTEITDAMPAGTARFQVCFRLTAVPG